MEKENLRTIVFIGDSITDCGRLFDQEMRGLGSGYVRRIANQLGAEARVINRGHNGFTAFQVEEHLEGDCLRFRPDEVSLQVGINDVAACLSGAGGYDAREYGSYLRKIGQRVKASGSDCFTILEPFLFPWPAEYLSWMDTLTEFQQATKEAARAVQARFLPLAQVFQDAAKRYSYDQLTTDGIHLTGLGHEILAKYWLSSHF